MPAQHTLRPRDRRRSMGSAIAETSQRSPRKATSATQRARSEMLAGNYPIEEAYAKRASPVKPLRLQPLNR
eukprot:2987444-Alexandrium_andersonii.AAC.1